MNYLKQAKAITDAAHKSYEFIQHCFGMGLTTFEEADKAMKSVHKDCLRDLEELYMHDQIQDNMYQGAQNN